LPGYIAAIAISSKIVLAAFTTGTSSMRVSPVSSSIAPMDVQPVSPAALLAKLLKSLASRGLRDLKLVISDAHERLKAAVRRVFGTTWPY
jgi:hypothetical protein